MELATTLKGFHRSHCADRDFVAGILVWISAAVHEAMKSHSPLGSNAKHCSQTLTTINGFSQDRGTDPESSEMGDAEWGVVPQSPTSPPALTNTCGKMTKYCKQPNKNKKTQISKILHTH
eukprot:EG_transcript_4642